MVQTKKKKKIMPVGDINSLFGNIRKRKKNN